MRELLKKELIKLFEGADWAEKIPDFYRDSRTDIIWVVNDFVKEGKYLEQAVVMAEIYKDDTDPTIESEENQQTLAGEEVHAIVSVRASLCWLLQTILAKLKTEHYPKVIDILEELANDKVYYVRMHAAVPLGLLASNLKAYKNADGSEFNFLPKDRERVELLVFKMIRDNQAYPRVMEYVAGAAASLRWLKERPAQEVLSSFFYLNNSPQPDYLSHRFAPLAIYFAVFRTNLNDGFDNSWFKEFLKKLIEESDPSLKGTLIWHFWKTIEDKQETYSLLKEYIPLFISEDMYEGVLGEISQMNFLIREVAKISPDDAFQLLSDHLEKVKDFTLKKISENNKEQFQGSKLFHRHQVWLHDMEEIAEQLATSRPKKLIEVLKQLKELLDLKVYIGDTKRIFASYKFVEESSREEVETKSKELYGALKANNSELPDLS